MHLQLHFDDYLAAMRRWPTNSVDALISDPPYATTALPWDKRIDWSAFWNEAYRITDDTSPIVLFSAQPFTTELINSNRKAFRYELIWAKTTATGFLDANRRPMRAHENILVFARKFKDSTYNPQKTPGKPYVGKKHEAGCRHYGDVKRVVTDNPTGARHPFSWQLIQRDNTGKGLHPTQKPIELMRWLVRTYTNPGDVIFDPFLGSGSTGVAAVQEGRGFGGSESDPQYFRTAAVRINEAAPR